MVLIPKKKQARTAVDFCARSLCNVVYKIITKTLANQLKVILRRVISSFQSAFVPSRLIFYNVIVAFGVFHSLCIKNNGEKSFMTLKLDISKAHDRVELEFLKHVMERFGFGDHWVRIIMGCITSSNFTFLINGTTLGYILHSRGL